MPEIHLQPLQPDGVGGCVGSVAADQFPYTIGRRRDCDLRLSDSSVSREHCRLFVRGGRVWVRDLESMNGTFVNEERVREPRPLNDGDVLRVAIIDLKVRIPATAVEQTVVQTPSDGSRPVRRRQVLVVEDDVHAAETMALVLKGWGCQVRVAHDGSEAVRSARAHPPDAVLLDVCLPGTDGYQVARRLRDEAGVVGARMVAMTGRADAADRRSPDDSGVQKLLIKPVGADTLREAVGAG